LERKNARNDLQFSIKTLILRQKRAVPTFHDLKVLELASVLAGPSVGQFFAELGAEVIKVENVSGGGDVTRSWKSAGEVTDDRSAYFCSVNWGKRSIAIDLSKVEGRDIVQKLASKCDIVIASYKPGDAEKLGVDYNTLSAINPMIIYGQISGYGPKNPRVGYDAIIQAEAGFMFMNGEPGGRSLKMPVALMDILAGHHLKEGLLVAMIEKSKTGKGGLVEVSLVQAAVASLANQATNWLVAKKLPQKQGSSHPNIAPYGDVFLTADGKEVMLAIGNDRQFQDLCEILKLSIGKDPKFATNRGRVENRGELYQLLNRVINQISSPDFMEKANASKIPSGIIQNIQECLEMPEVRELILSSADLKGLKTFASNPEFPNHFLPPPHFGEHTHYILSEYVGMSGNFIKKLVSEKVIV
jgi:crotonobetainyl-CoA:carnitine CoA-transferase CaiB-like acyl-CoA transferase